MRHLTVIVLTIYSSSVTVPICWDTLMGQMKKKGITITRLYHEYCSSYSDVSHQHHLYHVYDF